MSKLLICDLDNTLYDWVGYFVPSFYAMVDTAVQILDCDREQLLDDFKEVHQLHNDSEHPFALLETKTVVSRFPNKNRTELGRLLDPAFHAFNSVRKKRLQLYPGVAQALEKIVASDVILVAHTEGKLFSVLDRLNRLGLLNHFSRIYCRERSYISHVKDEVGRRWLEDFPMGKVVELSQHQRKPNPDVLKEICDREGVPKNDCVYVGDSVARDIMMAKELGIKAVWAQYGTNFSQEQYSKLVRVTHWKSEDVAREKVLKTKAASVRPDFVLNEGFSQILACYNSSERLALNK